jgi:hypothetical protein
MYLQLGGGNMEILNGWRKEKDYIKRGNNTVKETKTFATADITSPLLKRKPINNFICTNLHRSTVEGSSPTDAHFYL